MTTLAMPDRFSKGDTVHSKEEKRRAEKAERVMVDEGGFVEHKGKYGTRSKLALATLPFWSYKAKDMK